MELFQEILIKALAKEKIHVLLSNSEMDAAKIVERECYRTLQKIKTVIEDNSLSDAECFMKIEEIICIFDSIGSSGGNRHDFG